MKNSFGRILRFKRDKNKTKNVWRQLILLKNAREKLFLNKKFVHQKDWKVLER